MRALLDENIPRSVANALRERGHDVEEVCGSKLVGSTDAELWKLAQDQGRILITTDKDFAAYRDQPHHGILLIRLRQPSRAGIHDRVLTAVRNHSDWQGLFLSVRDRAQMVYHRSRAEDRTDRE